MKSCEQGLVAGGTSRRFPVTRPCAIPVSERVTSITLKVAVYEGDEAVTNIETVTFDSTSDKMDERKKWVHLVLQDRRYHKSTSYRLVLRDADTGIEQQSVPVIIDRVFTDDF